MVSASSRALGTVYLLEARALAAVRSWRASASEEVYLLVTRKLPNLAA